MHSGTVLKLMYLQQKASHQTSMHCACRFFILKKLGCATREAIAEFSPLNTPLFHKVQ